MVPDHFQVLARYNRWMNDKLYAVSAKLTDEERRRDRGAFFKSIHGTLNHVLVGDRIWMARFTGARLEPGSIGPGGIRSMDHELYENFEELRAARAQQDDEIEQWAVALTPQRLSETLHYGRPGSTGVALWWAITHFFNHQTHHRGQLTTLLSQAGHDPGVTDLIALLRTAPV